MTAERNTGLVDRYFNECVSRLAGPDRAAALAVVDEILTADFSMTYNNDPAQTSSGGLRRHKAFLVEHAKNYPDDRWTLEVLVANEATVACQWHLTARHAATGNSIDVRAADVFTVREGRLAELRRFLDFQSFRDQLRKP
jgi:ketosteroid isomerase-like protein